MNNTDAVITSYNQGDMVFEAVRSLSGQTMLPKNVIIIDDGSSDEHSLDVLQKLETAADLPFCLKIYDQNNSGVSAARNNGIRKTSAPFVLVLDGDDRLEPRYIEDVSALLESDQTMVAASSYLKTFGVLNAVVCPAGGSIVPFLSRNCCPASSIFRREAYDKCGGYDESMHSGFEDWDFFISLLETDSDSHIGIAESPLIDYRTSPASSNVKSMEKRLTIMRYMIEKHKSSYSGHLTDALLGIETISDARLGFWEDEISNTLKSGHEISDAAKAFINSPSYGDGGMAAAVRISSPLKKHEY